MSQHLWVIEKQGRNDRFWYIRLCFFQNVIENSAWNYVKDFNWFSNVEMINILKAFLWAWQIISRHGTDTNTSTVSQFWWPTAIIDLQWIYKVMVPNIIPEPIFFLKLLLGDRIIIHLNRLQNTDWKYKFFMAHHK